jgi:hypothetical protein
MNNKKLKKRSPLRYWQAAVAVFNVAYSIYSDSNRRSKANKALSDAKAEKIKQEELLEKEMGRYKAMKFENPYAENVFEDITVSKEAAEFQMEQAAQQRADVMASFRGAAGTSGVSSLAQSIVNQGQVHTRQVSADIARQEAANQKLIAQGELQRQKGEDWVQQQEIARNEAILSGAIGGAVGARQMQAQAAQNVLMAEAVGQQQIASSITGLGDVSGDQWNEFGDTMSQYGAAATNTWKELVKKYSTWRNQSTTTSGGYQMTPDIS